MEHDQPLSVDSLVLALRTLFDPAKAGDLSASLFLRFDGDEFRAWVTGGSFHVQRGATGTADATVTTDGSTLNEIIWSSRDLDASIRDGLLRVDGDLGMVRRFIELFPLPEPAATPASIAG